MKLRLIPAVLLGAVFAVAAHASAPASSSDIPPTVIAQLEIRGLAPLFGQTARIMAPFIPPQEADNAIKRFLRNICPVDLVSLVGADSADPIRAVVYSKPGAVSPGIMFDLPAANGDIDAFFAVVARSCATAAVPPAVAARLPSGARLYRLPSAAVATGSDPRVLFLPHGSRVAVWPLSMRGGVQPIQAARLVSAFPPIAAEGVIALHADLVALAALPPSQSGLFDGLTAASAEVHALPITAYTFGLGLDSADHLRFDISCHLRPDSAVTRYLVSFSAPAPFVNAALFPDAIAAVAQHADPSLVNQAYIDELFAGVASTPQAREIEPLRRGFAGLAPQLAAFSSSDSAIALYPSTADRALPWVSCTALPDGIASLDDFEPRASAVAHALRDLVAMALSAADADCDAIEDLAVCLVPVDTRSLADTDFSVRSYALTVAVPDEDPVTLLTFDAAIAGPALVLGSLPESRLAAILSTLSTGATPSTSIADLPAFADAYGPLPEGAYAAVVQFLPLLRSIAAKLQQYDIDLPADLPNYLSIFPDSLTLPIALTYQPGPAPSTIREILSLPLADLHTFIQSILASFPAPASSPDFSDAPSTDPFEDW
ncbi:MAG: hypothetical protein IJT88_04535 [Kiritimatiellae bacterium]|nr:hypothetical protein [Kiritimatiellia bacterium]